MITNLQGISEDGPAELNIGENQEEDLKILETLFKKIQGQYGIDKVKLVKSLLEG